MVLFFSIFIDICKCLYRYINELKINLEIDLFFIVIVYGIKLEYDDLLFV